ncbi:MAG: hypothetical protein ACOYW3_06670 [Bacteroidota bacterium]
MSRRHPMMPVKGYYTRAKVFFYLMAGVVIAYAFYSLFHDYFG